MGGGGSVAEGVRWGGWGWWGGGQGGCERNVGGRGDVGNGGCEPRIEGIVQCTKRYCGAHWPSGTDPRPGRCVVSLSKRHLLPKSTGNTQE